VISYHNNSLSSALKDLFPEIGLDISKLQWALRMFKDSFLSHVLFILCYLLILKHTGTTPKIGESSLNRTPENILLILSTLVNGTFSLENVFYLQRELIELYDITRTAYHRHYSNFFLTLVWTIQN